MALSVPTHRTGGSACLWSTQVQRLTAVETARQELPVLNDREKRPHVDHTRRGSATVAVPGDACVLSTPPRSPRSRPHNPVARGLNRPTQLCIKASRQGLPSLAVASSRPCREPA